MALARYRSHKEVEAVKIADIRWVADGAEIVGTDGEQVMVSIDYCTKHQPKKGGYYVKYADGYESWSPAEAFETGHTRL